MSVKLHYTGFTLRLVTGCVLDKFLFGVGSESEVVETFTVGRVVVGSDSDPRN